MTDYSTSKYQNAIAEAGDAIINEGFAEAQLGDESDHYALVVVDGGHAIIRTDSDGFVWEHASEQNETGRHIAPGACWVQAAWQNLADAYDRESDEADVCEWNGTTAGECAMLRERSVAGKSDDIPSCATHGAYSD